MNENFTITERLVRYFDNEMNEMERKNFESEIAGDTNLQAELDFLRTTQKAVKHQGIATKVSKLHTEMMRELTQPIENKPQATRLVKMFTSPLRIAAAVTVFLFAATLFEYVTISSQNVFSSQYIQYELPNTRGDAAADIRTTYYLEKRYNLYITAFEKLTNPASNDIFMAGISYLELGQSKKAQNQFLSLQTPGNDKISLLQQEDIDYYLALAYLRNNQPSQAYPLFQKIYENKNHSYHNKVSRWLLIKLKMLSFKTR
jgi:hypothetical protein